MPRKPSEVPAHKSIYEPRVEVVPVEGASVLTTLAEGWEGWGGDFGLLLDAFSERHFVRLRPPAGTGSRHVEQVKEWLEARGVRVKVELAREPDVVPREEGVRVERPHARAREVVEDLLRASRSESQEELAVFVRRKMDEAKL